MFLGTFCSILRGRWKIPSISLQKLTNAARIISDALDVMSFLHGSDFTFLRLFFLDSDLWHVPGIVWVLDGRNALRGFRSIVKVPYSCSRRVRSTNTVHNICTILRRDSALVFQPRRSSAARRPNSASPAPERAVKKATVVRQMHCALPEPGWRSFFGWETFCFLPAAFPAATHCAASAASRSLFFTLTVKLSDHLGLHCEALHLRSVLNMLEHLNSLHQATSLCSEPAAHRRCILTCGPVPLVVPRSHG